MENIKEEEKLWWKNINIISIIIAFPLSVYIYWNSVSVTIFGFILITFFIWSIIVFGLNVLVLLIFEPKLILEYAKTKETKFFCFVAVLISVLMLAYIYKSSPTKSSPDILRILKNSNKVVLNESAEVMGLLNKARAVVQGKSFWKAQLHEIRLYINDLETHPERMAKVKRDFAPIIKMLSEKEERRKEEMYRKNPETRPTAAQRKTETLREQARKIQESEDEHLHTFGRLKKLAELRKIIPIVKAKAE